MATDPTQQITPPTPDSIPITDPTASQNIPIDLNPEYDPAKDTRAPFLKVNPNPKGPTIEPAPTRSVGQVIKEAVTENIPQFSSRTSSNPKYGKESFLPDSEIMTAQQRREAPALAGGLDVASELASPATVSTVAATAGLGEAGVIPKVLSGLFAGQIAASVYDQYPALKAAVDKAQHAKSQEEHDDAFSDAQRILTHMGADTVMGLLAAKHGTEGAKEILDATTGSGVPDQASTFKAPTAEPNAPKPPAPEDVHPEYNRQTVKELQKLGYSSQHITQFNITEIRDILKNHTPAAEYKFPKDNRQWFPNQPPEPAAQPEVSGPIHDGLVSDQVGGKLVGPQPAEAVEKPVSPVENAAETADSIEDLIMSDKIGGKKVRGATPKVEPLAVAQQAIPRGLVERTTGDEQADAHIKAAGAIPAGNMAGLAMFHDPKTGSTLALKAEDVTPEAVQQHLAASRKSFGLAPEPDALASAGGKFVGEQPTAADKATTAIANLYMDRDENAHPFTYSYSAPFTNKTAPSLILPDGRVTNARLSHSELARAAGFEPKAGALSTTHIDDMLDNTGAARVIYPEGGRGNIGVQIHQPPTPDQLQIVAHNLKKAQEAGIGDGSLAWDLKNPEGKMISGAGSVGDFRRAVDIAYPDQQVTIDKELQNPHKQTYGMEVTDSEGNSQTVKVDAHSPKQALATVVKKFPDASEWRLANMPEEKAPSTEYSVPTGKIQKMKESAGRTEVETMGHELGHALVGQAEGLKQGGILSSSHPEMPKDARAGVVWPGRNNVLWSASGQVRPEAVAPIVRTLMGGIAADEAFNDLHRSTNHNFRLDAGGDGSIAYRILQAAGLDHESAMEFLHKAIDYGKEYLLKPEVTDVFVENVNVREPGLSRQYHISPERLESMHQEAQRRIANAKEKSTPENNDDGATGGGSAEVNSADVARGEGASTNNAPSEPAETEEGIIDEDKIKKTKASKEEPPEVSPNEKLQASAQKYAAAHDMPEINHEPVRANSERAKEIAKIYDEAKHDPNDPRVKAAYDALKSETLAQFHHLRDDLGLKFKPQEEDPYPSAEAMMDDIKKKNQLKVFTGSSTGEDHPLSAIAPGTGGQSYNTVFRWVHDAMGHAAGGNDFSENGEKSATEAHAQMYSDTARPAMRAETEGQTSWFFHNPEVESGKSQPGKFAEQKATILPDVSHDWHEAAGKMAATDEAGGINPRTGKSDTKGIGTEILPEGRQPLDHAPTAQDFKNFYDQHKEIFDQYPELRVGWDNKSAMKGGHEINIGAVGPNAAKVAAKLDQKSAWDIAKQEIIPTGGTGLKTEFKEYPLAQRIRDLKGESLHTVSTRVPTGKVKGEVVEDHTDQSRMSDMDAAKAAPGYVQKMVNRINETPGFVAPAGDAQARADAYIRHAADNIKFVSSKISPEEFKRDEQWYPVGAHERGQAVAKQHDVTPHQVYAVTAVESPMTDWDQNTSLAERTVNIWKNQQNTKFTPEMQQAANKITDLPANKSFKPFYKKLQGKTLAELPTTTLQAHWLRLYDEAHNPREYETWGPDGQSHGLAKNQEGGNKQVGWSFQRHIEKAIEILKDGSDENISKQLGYGHKVRNFYNNQVAPDDPRFLTIDTHAVNVAQLRPMSGKTQAVVDNFGNIKNGAHGLKGTYPLHDAAYRLAAKELDIPIPGRLQSPTWVKIRDVFTDDFKTPENQAAIDAIWKEHADGKITADEARNRVWDYATRWNRERAAGVGATRDQGQLFEAGVSGESATGTIGRGNRSGTAREVPAPVDEATSFDFGANAKPALSRVSKVSDKQRAANDAKVAGIIAAMRGLDKK